MTQNFDPKYVRLIKTQLEIPNTCQRCLIGVDNDGDGHCQVCVNIPQHANLVLLYLTKRLKELLSEVEKSLPALEALEKLKQYLSTTNPQ